jgi:hypothetical protein
LGGGVQPEAYRASISVVSLRSAAAQIGDRTVALSATVAPAVPKQMLAAAQIRNATIERRLARLRICALTILNLCVPKIGFG